MTNEKSPRSAPPPMLLADEDLGTVSGARCNGRRRRRRHGHGHDHDHGGGGGGLDLEALLSSLGNFQTNVTGPIIQIAIGNGGDITQIVSISQSNSASF
jgi:hypothetical protein